MAFSSGKIQCQDIARGDVHFSALPSGNTCQLGTYESVLQEACLKYQSGGEGQACGLSFVKEGEQEVEKIDSEFFLTAMNQQIAARAVSGYQDYGLALPLDNLVQQEDIDSGTRELVVQAPQSDIFTQSYDDDTYTHFLATDEGVQVLVPMIESDEQAAPEGEHAPETDLAEAAQGVGCEKGLGRLGLWHIRYQ
ncbi:MAG: hypothetical protein V6Z78_02920 [Holosporaceae bacterium]